MAVGLKAESKRDIIEQLTRRLYATTDIAVEKEIFLREAIKREEEATSLGSGFMVLHISTPHCEAAAGVLGLSGEGLAFDAPDGQRVHAVLLLVTPSADAKRHREILSAFTYVVLRTPELREQLYQAHSEAHAYQLLHANDATGFNYFLEDVRTPSTAKP